MEAGRWFFGRESLCLEMVRLKGFGRGVATSFFFGFLNEFVQWSAKDYHGHILIVGDIVVSVFFFSSLFLSFLYSLDVVFDTRE